MTREETMASSETRCPECESDLDFDGYDLDQGESTNCPECSIELLVTNLDPVTLTLPPED
jgi:uncharacterized paraquat-inducible protein A